MPAGRERRLLGQRPQLQNERVGLEAVLVHQRQQLAGNQPVRARIIGAEVVERLLADAGGNMMKTPRGGSIAANPCVEQSERVGPFRGRDRQALDRYDLLILDDIAYVTKDQAETSVLFELIAARDERRSMLITSNQPFGEWGRIFPDQAMTLAAIDRLIHHATILEMNVESYRRKEALDRKRSRGRPPAHATPKELEHALD